MIVRDWFASSAITGNQAATGGMEGIDRIYRRDWMAIVVFALPPTDPHGGLKSHGPASYFIKEKKKPRLKILHHFLAQQAQM
jgi:hypothetical protein